MSFTITQGFNDNERPCVAHMFWAAFAGKLGFALGPQARAVPYLSTILQPQFALVARGGAGDIQGVVGFKTANGGLFGGGYRDIARAYGWVGGLWRGMLLDCFERPLASGQLLLDGLFVAEPARGHGIGTRLLHATCDMARTQGATCIRLDVIDGNDAAHRLYKRFGFYDVTHHNTKWLAPILGFKGVTEMRLDLG